MDPNNPNNSNPLPNNNGLGTNPNPTPPQDPVNYPNAPANWPSAPLTPLPSTPPFAPAVPPDLSPASFPPSPQQTPLSQMPISPQTYPESTPAATPPDPTPNPLMTPSPPDTPPMPANPLPPTPDPSVNPASLSTTPVNPVADLNSAASVLDNPWNSPPQPQPLDNNPAATAPTTAAPAVSPSWMSVGNSATETTAGESAPTDLSHLISNNPQPEPPQGLPETLVVPPQTPPADVASATVEGHKGIPKWAIGLAVGLLIVVAGASAYFILGIGQPAKTTSSIPAEITKESQQVKPPAPIATPVVQTQPPTASGSANFGQLQGEGTQIPSATSAADLIRQRQGR